MGDLVTNLTAYLSAHRGARDLRVETLRITAALTYHRPLVRRRSGRERGLILRRDRQRDRDRRALEFALSCVPRSGVPVPEPLLFETDPIWLERPFFVMEEIAGCQASPTALAAPPYVGGWMTRFTSFAR
jgi:aminoglycoside phosphotransferase (APT) family kinase protein